MLKQSPHQESSRSSSSLPSSAAAQSVLPSGQQQHQLQVKLAQLRKWKATCTDEETKQWLDTRISDLQLQLSRGRSAAQQIKSAKEEEKKTQDCIERMLRHVAEVFEKIEAAKARKAAVRETISHLQTKLLTESAPHESNHAPPVPPEQLLRQVWDTADEVPRSSDLFSAIRRAVIPDLKPARSPIPKQMEMETPQFNHSPPSDNEISDVEQVDNEGEVEQLERFMHIQAENSQLVPFRKKVPKKPKS